MKKTFIILFLVVLASTAKATTSSLHETVKKNNTTALISLIDTKKYNINDYDEEGFTPLHYAALLGHLACAHILVDNGKADLDIVVKRGQYIGNTAKRLAQRAKKTDLVAFFKAKKMHNSFDDCDCFGSLAWVIS